MKIDNTCVGLGAFPGNRQVTTTDYILYDLKCMDDKGIKSTGINKYSGKCKEPS